MGIRLCARIRELADSATVAREPLSASSVPANRGEAEFRRHSDASGRRCSRPAELRLASVAFLLLPGSSPLARVRVRNGLPTVDQPGRLDVPTEPVSVVQWSVRDPSASSRGGPAASSRAGPAASSRGPDGTRQRCSVVDPPSRPVVHTGPISDAPRWTRLMVSRWTLRVIPRSARDQSPCPAVDPPPCPEVRTEPYSVLRRSRRDSSASYGVGPAARSPGGPVPRPAVRTGPFRVILRWTRPIRTAGRSGRSTAGRC